MKDRIVKVRMSEQQFDAITNAANKMGIATSTMMRWAALQVAVKDMPDGLADG